MEDLYAIIKILKKPFAGSGSCGLLTYSWQSILMSWSQVNKLPSTDFELSTQGSASDHTLMCDKSRFCFSDFSDFPSSFLLFTWLSSSPLPCHPPSFTLGSCFLCRHFDISPFFFLLPLLTSLLHSCAHVAYILAGIYEAFLYILYIHSISPLSPHTL